MTASVKAILGAALAYGNAHNKIADFNIKKYA